MRWEWIRKTPAPSHDHDKRKTQYHCSVRSSLRQCYLYRWITHWSHNRSLQYMEWPIRFVSRLPHAGIACNIGVEGGFSGLLGDGYTIQRRTIRALTWMCGDVFYNDHYHRSYSDLHNICALSKIDGRGSYSQGWKRWASMWFFESYARWPMFLSPISLRDSSPLRYSKRWISTHLQKSILQQLLGLSRIRANKCQSD